jgi:DNA uptake protein ComE-like DNA-binding protein
MKDFPFEHLKEWFGYTRRERRASFVLLILILFLTGLRYFIPAQNITIDEMPIEITDTINTYMSGIHTRGAGPSSQRARLNQQRPLIDLNSCDSASLEALPGIGPVLSARIIKYRNLLGGFAEVDQLKEVYGLREETFNLIEGRVFADTSAVIKIRINTADYRQLVRLPYFERYEVSAILKYRELNGKISGISDLIDNMLIAPEKAKKVRPYLEFGER